jgi:hypothetical protein
LNAASVPRVWSEADAVSTYTAIDIVSSARNISSRSVACTISIMPTIAKSSSA